MAEQGSTEVIQSTQGCCDVQRDTEMNMAYNEHRGNADGGDEGRLVDDDGNVIECYENCHTVIETENDGMQGEDGNWRCAHCHEVREAANEHDG